MNDEHPAREITLDPNYWEEFRALAHRMVDDTVDFLRSLRERPAWEPMPDAVRGSFPEPLPVQGEGAAEAYHQFAERILPYTNGNRHPRFWGWVQGNGTPLGMMADMLAAAMYPHLAGFDQAPVRVEEQVHAWLAELMGLPATATGILVEGGTMANVLGLAVARHHGAGFDVRREGHHAGRARMTFYGSAETHGWANKAAEFLGMGSESFRMIPVDDAYRIDTAALARAVAEDRSAGHHPFCVIGTAGTVNTGAIDDLATLADFCAAEGLWFHVDGAFGALARLSPALAPLLAGMERADSLALDLHKWGWLPFGVACALVRDGDAHRAAFSMRASYLAGATRGPIAGGLPFADLGMDLTRGFKALKVWMSMKAHGTGTMARLIEQNVAQTRYLASLIDASPDLELLAPVPLNIACFRYAPDALAEDRLNAVNEEILLRLQEREGMIPSATTLEGRYAIRVANVNHRSRREDFDALAAAVVRIGREVAREMVGGGD